MIGIIQRSSGYYITQTIGQIPSVVNVLGDSSFFSIET